jgi:hypothetical protein
MAGLQGRARLEGDGCRVPGRDASRWAKWRASPLTQMLYPIQEPLGTWGRRPRPDKSCKGYKGCLLGDSLTERQRAPLLQRVPGGVYQG